MIPILFLPGMMCDARLFWPQVSALSGTYPVHLAPITSHDSVQALAAEILENAPRRFALAGLSMGGIVAMEVFAQAPDRVGKIAFLDTNPKAGPEAAKQARESQITRVLAGDLKKVMREELKPKYLSEGPRKNQILDICMDMALGLGKEVFVRQSRALQNRPDQQETLRRIQVPTLILCGEDDQICPLERHELMHNLVEDSRLEIIKAAGHLPTLEQPDATTAALVRWLEK